MKANHIPKRYIVLFVDFLGQKEFFKEIKDIKVNKVIEDKISTISNSVVRGIQGFNLLADKVIEGSDRLYDDLVTKRIEPYCSAPKEWFRYEMEHCRPKVHTFSDSTMVYFPMHDDVAPLIMPMLMFFLCQLFLQNLSEGNLYRGVITFGDGWEISDGVLYGPVVDRAGFIEKNVASYPRIVVSDEVFDYFDFNQINKSHPSIRKLIEIDSDGAYILNYLSMEFLKSPILGDRKEIVWKYVCYMHRFVREKLSKYRSDSNVKLFHRYRMWDAYSYRHEEELKANGILRDIDLIKYKQHNRIKEHKLSKYLLLYLQFQPAPLSKIGYDGMIENAGIISWVAKEMDALNHRLKDNARELFKEQFSNDLTIEQIEAEVGMIQNASCGTIQMSNYLMVYVNNLDHCVAHYFYAWLVQLKELLRHCSTKGVFVRGSFDYGIGWELESEILYGPVIQNAAELEESKAFYPRIIISESLEKELKMGVSKEDDYLWSEYIRRDEDNIWIFDYLEIGKEELESKQVILSKIKEGYSRAICECRGALQNSRINYTVNPNKSWPLIWLEMYFRRKLQQAEEKCSNKKVT